MEVLKTLSPRLFIPFQAAVEYQRSRLSTIATQRNRFGEVRKLLSSVQNDLQAGLDGLQLAKRHSSINPDRLLRGVGDLFDSFLAGLDSLKATHPDVTDDDKIRDVLDEILTPRIGPVPSQAELDAIHSEGKKRYEHQRPPGFADAGKAKGEEPAYTINGLRIERQYGDLLVWKQIISAAKADQVEHLVLVTDDVKLDWWLMVKSDGPKTIGPRPELVEEARLDGGVKQFYMYNSEQFIKFAREYLGATVRPESISQIRNARHLNALGATYPYAVELAVFAWLKRIHATRSVLAQRMFPDYVVRLEDGACLGYEVKVLLPQPRSAAQQVRHVISRNGPEMKRLYVVLVAMDDMSLEFAQAAVPGLDLPLNVSVVLGHLELGSDEDGDPEETLFVPDIEHPRAF